MDNHQQTSRLEQVQEQYKAYQNRPFEITIARGIPSTKQLELAKPLLDKLVGSDWLSEDEQDIRNYGGLMGIKEARSLFSDLLGTSIEETIVAGNSSLQLMYSVLIMHMYTGKSKWNNEEKVKFLCPSPGYDRHFSMLERLGIEMIPVELTGSGPDMEVVEKIVSQDASIKGIFCVPTYSNPTGETYSDEVVERLADMHTAAEDFLIMWDNAYTVHHLFDEKEQAINILEACKEAGVPDRPFMFVSTSKMTFPGAGVAAVGASETNILRFAEELSKQIISFDKLNQKRHVDFLKDQKTIERLMEKHADILRPKFEWIQAIFEAYFAGERSRLLKWTEPKGGYFVHLTTANGCATEIVDKMEQIGIQLTPANATYPYGINPLDNSIRLAPSYIGLDKLEVALEALCTCVELVTLEKYGENFLGGE
ncbi:aminotransferase class I/II-fold pyridoxal phosphate-dependent enzyme [Marinilactibacillus sp. Marseille-P9653]|uniref:aminotransferase class I/II-fold pyridoxal phosphate-dependent enzyme n=1 Tax=Marinilactibacillus sp. Marseille-P9653 TaxID=2866583 RepID=UPI001CE49121|nr:aminotransferase class I/II-fold pyridoxal phosphate-dependent enzyme [Marinilactibacillus sp. Marseille-P9653]